MTDTNKCKATLWDHAKQMMWKCELKKGHKTNHKATFNWIESGLTGEDLYCHSLLATRSEDM